MVRIHRSRPALAVGLGIVGLTLWGVACAQTGSGSGAGAGHAGHAQPVVAAADLGMGGPTQAVAVITGTKGNEKVKGTVTFTETGTGGVKVVAHVEGLTPGKHGFHVHEFGDMRSEDGMAMGGHYNPSKAQHGAPGEASHVGDMGNLEAGADGTAHLEVTVPHGSVAGKNGLLGRGLIVHAGEDDLKTQPTGNAGGRVGQGVIGVAKPAAPAK